MFRLIAITVLLTASNAIAGDSAQRHSSGRPLPAMPAISEPVIFDTPQADRVLEALQVFPPDNPWNEDVSARPVATNSREIVDSIGANKTLRYNRDMGFILIPPDQKRVPVKITEYPAESDRGPYPVPDNAPIENWPLSPSGTNRASSLAEIQRRGDGDRHLIVVDPVKKLLFEFYIARRTNDGWQAAQASIFDLASNKLRPDGWTSADAAGLPVFPAVVRFDELERGCVEHAMRVTVRRTRRQCVYPATHFASRETDARLPRMGERLRLKSDYDTSSFSPHSRAILKGLQRYGMLVADNGLDWSISLAPDERIKGLDDLRRVHGSDFEVIVPTGPREGPRAK